MKVDHGLARNAYKTSLVSDCAPCAKTLPSAPPFAVVFPGISAADGLASQIKHTPVPQIKHSPAPEMKHAPVPQLKHTPAPQMKHAPVPQIKHTPAPQSSTGEQQVIFSNNCILNLNPSGIVNRTSVVVKPCVGGARPRMESKIPKNLKITKLVSALCGLNQKPSSLKKKADWQCVAKIFYQTDANVRYRRVKSLINLYKMNRNQIEQHFISLRNEIEEDAVNSVHSNSDITSTEQVTVEADKDIINVSSKHNTEATLVLKDSPHSDWDDSVSDVGEAKSPLHSWSPLLNNDDNINKISNYDKIISSSNNHTDEHHKLIPKIDDGRRGHTNQSDDCNNIESEARYIGIICSEIVHCAVQKRFSNSSGVIWLVLKLRKLLQKDLTTLTKILSQI